jgi:hypothetical protein
VAEKIEYLFEEIYTNRPHKDIEVDFNALGVNSWLFIGAVSIQQRVICIFHRKEAKVEELLPTVGHHNATN